MLTPSIYLVPRWGGTIHADWYDWFVEEAAKRYGLEVARLKMPNWHQPDVKESVQFLAEQIPSLHPDTYFIGHSVGCQAILRFLASTLEADETLTVGGLLFVAGWINVVKSWSTLDPWLANQSLPYALIAERTNQKTVVISDNDPFTPDFKANEALWRNRLKADVRLSAGRGHFNGAIELSVIAAFDEMMKARYLSLS